MPQYYWKRRPVSVPLGHICATADIDLPAADKLIEHVPDWLHCPTEEMLQCRQQAVAKNIEAYIGRRSRRTPTCLVAWWLCWLWWPDGLVAWWLWWPAGQRRILLVGAVVVAVLPQPRILLVGVELAVALR